VRLALLCALVLGATLLLSVAFGPGDPTPAQQDCVRLSTLRDQGAFRRCVDARTRRDER
jgi:hypothetical protein